jgi:hypothetical protein
LVPYPEVLKAKEVLFLAAVVPAYVGLVLRASAAQIGTTATATAVRCFMVVLLSPN